MENEFLKYLNLNIKKIYDDFVEVFNIDYMEYVTIIKRIVKDITKDDFYKQLLQSDISINFDKNSLLKVDSYLKLLNMDDNNGKKIVSTIPELILFINNQENIFPIYKNEKFKGFAFVYENNYRSYSCMENNYKLNNLNNITENNVNYYNYVIEDLIKSLDREDIKQSLNIKDNSTLKEKFLSLSKNYSKKNYYFKKIQ